MDTLALIDFETTGLQPASKHFPIEIGILFVRDDNLSVIGAVDSLIAFDEFDADAHLGAFQVNNFQLDDLRNAPTPLMVQGQIADAVAKCPGRVRLCSDNIVFDESYMRRLWELAEVEMGEPLDWPFHYSSDDVSLLFRQAGIERRKKPHRAMADTGGLYLDLIEARRKIHGILACRSSRPIFAPSF